MNFCGIFFHSQVSCKTNKNLQIELTLCVNRYHNAMYQNMQSSFLSLLLDFLLWGFISYSQFFHLILSLPFPKGDIFPYQVGKLADTTGLSLKRHLKKYTSFTWKESDTDWSPELTAIVPLLHLGSRLIPGSLSWYHTLYRVTSMDRMEQAQVPSCDTRAKTYFWQQTLYINMNSLKKIQIMSYLSEIMLNY